MAAAAASIVACGLAGGAASGTSRWTPHTRRRYVLGLFKRNIVADWTLWLAAFAIVAGVAGVQGDY